MRSSERERFITEQAILGESHREPDQDTHNRYNAETQVKPQAERGGSRNSKTANRLSECTLESHCRRRRGESVPHLSPYHVPAAQCSAPAAEVEHVRVTSCSWPDQDTFRGAVARRAWARYSSGINIALPSMITYARQRKCHGMSHAAPRSWLWFQSLYHWSDSGVSMPTHSLTSALTH